MNALDIREQQVDPAGSGTPAAVAPDPSSEPETVSGTESGAAVADAAETPSTTAEQNAQANGSNGDVSISETAPAESTEAPEATTPTAEDVPAEASASDAATIDTPAASDDAPASSAEETAAPVDAPATDESDMFGFGDDMGDVASLMEQYLSNPEHDYKTLKYGDVMDGIVMHVDRDELLVDIGSKAEGIIPAKEYSDLTAEEKSALQIGDTILVFVVQPENPEGHPIVSINRARQEKSWRRLQELHEANEVIEAEVTNYNKGGLLVNLDGVRGFVPASQVTEIRGGDDASKQADMARLIGNTLPLKIIEINRHRNRLILSERQAIQERRDVMKEKLISELKESEVRKGRVSSICDFGAFVDIGGADGLVHLSELSWSRVRHPSELLKVGQEVDVFVLGINAQEKKIALSIKRTQAEPWSRVAAAYEVGQLVPGTVTQLANFGAFARIEDGIEGLVHVSELADERITHPKQAVKEGQDLILRIIRIDPQRRRMGLSLRRALDTPDTELIGVFGDDAIEMRDRIVGEIRTSLEAEGIDYQPGRSDAPAAMDDVVGASSVPGEQATLTAPVQEDPDGSIAAEATTSAPSSAMSDFQMPTPRPQPKKRDQRERRPERTAEVAPDEEMSAMAMAFAMAGAQADENAETASASSEAGTSDEPVVEATSAEAPAAEAAETEAAEVPVTEATAEDTTAPEATDEDASATESAATESVETDTPATDATEPEVAATAEEPAAEETPASDAPEASADEADAPVAEATASAGPEAEAPAAAPDATAASAEDDHKESTNGS